MRALSKTARSVGFLPYTFSIKINTQYMLIYVLNNETHLLKNRIDESWRDAENDVTNCDGRVIGGGDRGHDVGQIDVSTLHHLSHEWHVHHAHVKVAEGLHHSSVIAGCNRRFPEITGKDNLTVFSYSGRVKSPEWRWQRRRADLRHFEILRNGPIIIYTRLPAGGTYYPICTFPESSECLIGISDAFSAFCLRVSVILPPCSLYP